MKKHLLIVAAALLCILCLAACGGKKESEGSGAVQPAPAKASVDPALVGTWEEADVPEDQKLGDYWTFNDDGTGVYGLMDVEIDYTASGGTLHFSCDYGEYDYTYSIDGNVLTMTEEGSSSNQYQKK
ncbi:MAG: DUF5640 domain-containing protein [Lachnospiraceae bacterium]|nr:DUF5640 domain-containing protein [Lachnospiraceae bacterium]